MQGGETYTYKGEWLDGKMHGFGTYKYPKGSKGLKYEGSFKYGDKHGLGTFKFADGNQYIGHFKKGKMHG